MTDYTNQTDVQKCELVSLSDLRTESSYVRGKLAGYLNDLLSLGVDGFRVASTGTAGPLTMNDSWRRQ